MTTTPAQIKKTILDTEKKIKQSMIEIERVEAKVKDLQAELDMVLIEAGTKSGELKNLQNREAVLSGRVEIDRATADEKAELDTLAAKITKCETEQCTGVNAKVRNIKTRIETVNVLLESDNAELAALKDTIPALYEQYYKTLANDKLPEYIKKAAELADIVAYLYACDTVRRAHDTISERGNFMLPMIFDLDEKLINSGVYYFKYGHNDSSYVYDVMKPAILEHVAALEKLL